MNYEQKYKEALERARKCWGEYNDIVGAYENKDVCEEIFPELAESEDEKIKSYIQYAVRCAYGDSSKTESILAWLEKKSEQKIPKFKTGDFIQYKGMGHNRYTINEVCGTTHYINSQGKRMDMSYTDANFELVEQKPVEKTRLYDSMDELIADALIEMVEKSDLIDRDKKNRLVWIEKHRAKSAEWREEDKTMLCYMEGHLEYLKKDKGYSSSEDQMMLKRQLDWLKSLKKRVLLQPNQEWSEEDKQTIKDVIILIEDGALSKEEKEYYINKLKSLRPQFTWKPSDEQIIALRWVLNNIPYNKHKEEISGLLDQIKEL